MSHTKVLVAQMGARRHYLIPILFHQWGNLEKFCTDFYSANNGLTQVLRQAKIYNYLPNILKKGLHRYEPALEKAPVIQFPRLAYQYTQALRQASFQEVSQIKIQISKEFCRRIIKHGLGNANVVYGFNGASLELFKYAKGRGIRCVLDQTLAERSLVHQLLLQEEKTWPEWSLSPFRVYDADLELMQREQEEQNLADHIICGSDFVKNSLVARGVSANKVSVVALGCRKYDHRLKFKPVHKILPERGDELRILFAGTVGLRKGIPYLLEALSLLKGKIPFTCKIVGSIEIKPQRVAEYRDVCNFLGRVPRSQMADVYAWADVFVFPSICEGSAMVIHEALSWNIPIITTYNSGSIIRHKVDGFIVPSNNSKTITENLIKCSKGNWCHEAKKISLEHFLTSVYEDGKFELHQLITNYQL